MGNDPKQPDVGDLVIDASDLASFVVDLPPGARLGMRSEQPGFDAVMAEILANQPTLGERAGITATNFAALQQGQTRISQIDSRLPAARKMVELLEETRAVEDDRMQRLVSAIAISVTSRSRAFNDDELVARYEKTCAYRSAVANKAARTRQRNLEEDTGGLPVELPVEPPVEPPIA